MLHLFHPAFVHFALACLVMGGSCEAWGVLRRRRGVERFGGTLVAVGCACLVPTIVTGYLAANSVELRDAARPVLERHEQVGLLLLAWFILALFWKGWERGEIAESRATAYALLLLGGVALAAYAALLGGELVYVHGTGVLAD